MKQRDRNLQSHKRGLTTVEYAIILGVILVTAFVIWAQLSSQVNRQVSSSGDAFDTAIDTHPPGPGGKGKDKGKGKGKDKDKDKGKGKGKDKGSGQAWHDITQLASLHLFASQWAGKDLQDITAANCALAHYHTLILPLRIASGHARGLL